MRGEELGSLLGSWLRSWLRSYLRAGGLLVKELKGPVAR